MEDITIVILAGGKSSRMKQDKGLMLVNGKPMVQHLIDVSQSLKLKTILIANNTEYTAFGIPVYEDVYKESGPLGGIHSGFTHSQTPRIIVLSCDTPFVNTALIKHLIEASNSHDITVPRHGFKTHPLIGVYSRNILNLLIESIDNNNLRVIDLIKKTIHLTLDVTTTFSADIFENINTKKDLYAQVNIKPFGIIKERIKGTDLTMSIPNKKNINLRNYFNDKWPFLNDISYTIAIDQELREELNKNEHPNEIAILPPFAGG
jgi:molybdopterin-guanine dinucleotide biosynthesis protein A